MRINKEKLEMLSRLSDDELWSEVKKMAGGYGVRLPDRTPDANDIKKLRSVISDGNINIADAMRLINEYKRKNGV